MENTIDNKQSKLQVTLNLMILLLYISCSGESDSSKKPSLEKNLTALEEASENLNTETDAEGDTKGDIDSNPPNDGFEDISSGEYTTNEKATNADNTTKGNTIEDDVPQPTNTFQLISSSVTSNSISLEWSKVTNSTKYAVLWSNTNGGNLVKETSENTFVFSNINTSGNNYISIYPCNESGCSEVGINAGPL